MLKLLAMAVCIAVLAPPVAAETSPGAAPTLLASIPSMHAINGVEVIDGFAYIADTYRIRVVDVRDPAKPRVTWSSPRSKFYAETVRRVGADILYVSGTPGEETGRQELTIKIYRILKPGVVKAAGSFTIPVPKHHKRMFVLGDTVYVPGGEGGLFIIDASNPLKPRLLATDPLGADRVDELAFEGDRMWATVGHATTMGKRRVVNIGMSVAVVDVTDPRKPRVLGEVRTGTQTSRLAVHAGIGYATRGDGAVSVIDLRAKGAPEIAHVQLEGHVPNKTGIDDFVFAGDGLVVAGTNNNALTVFDVSKPESPRALASFAGRDMTYEVRSYGDLLFVCGHQYGGLRIFKTR